MTGDLPAGVLYSEWVCVEPCVGEDCDVFLQLPVLLHTGEVYVEAGFALNAVEVKAWFLWSAAGKGKKNEEAFHGLSIHEWENKEADKETG